MSASDDSPVPPDRQQSSLGWDPKTNWNPRIAATPSQRNAALLDSGATQVFPPPQEPTIESIPPANSAATVDVPPDPVAGTVPEAHPGASTLQPDGNLTADAEVLTAERRTRGAALTANRQVIVISAAALLVLVDEKIQTLDRANSDEARTELELFRGIKRELDNIRIATAELPVNGSEDAAVEASTSFLHKIRDWWNKRHIEICSKTFDASIFLSCVGVLHLTGANPTLGAVLAGVLAKESMVTDALKAAAKLISDNLPKQ